MGMKLLAALTALTSAIDPLMLMMMGDDSDSSWSPKPAAEYAAVCAKITDLAAKSECDNNFGKIYSGCTTSDTTACTYICDAAGAAASCEADAKTACKAIVGDTSSDSGIDDDLLMIMMMGGMNGIGGGAPGAPGQMDPMMMMSLLGRK